MPLDKDVESNNRQRALGLTISSAFAGLNLETKRATIRQLQAILATAEQSGVQKQPVSQVNTASHQPVQDAQFVTSDELLSMPIQTWFSAGEVDCNFG